MFNNLLISLLIAYYLGEFPTKNIRDSVTLIPYVANCKSDQAHKNFTIQNISYCCDPELRDVSKAGILMVDLDYTFKLVVLIKAKLLQVFLLLDVKGRVRLCRYYNFLFNIFQPYNFCGEFYWCNN